MPLGNYRITVELAGFATQAQDLTLTSGRDARLHFSLTIAQTKETVEVKDTAAAMNPESSTTQSVISRQQIASTPGADQTNSLTMITDYVPSAYMVHDQLHIRGGHQVSWLLPFLTPASPQMWARNSIQKILIISKCNAEAIRQNTAIALTECSTS